MLCIKSGFTDTNTHSQWPLLRSRKWSEHKKHFIDSTSSVNNIRQFSEIDASVDGEPECKTRCLIAARFIYHLFWLARNMVSQAFHNYTRQSASHRIYFVCVFVCYRSPVYVYAIYIYFFGNEMRVLRARCRENRFFCMANTTKRHRHQSDTKIVYAHQTTTGQNKPGGK